MNWRAADKVAAWKLFKRRMNVIFMADQIPEERQSALIQAYNRWDTLEETVEDHTQVDQVWDAFEKSFEQSTSFWHFRHLSRTVQDEAETTADLDLRIKQTVHGCQWKKGTEEEQMIDLLYHATIYYEICKYIQEAEPSSHDMTRSQMGKLRDQQQRITVLKQVAMQPQNQPRPVSAPPAANMPLPPYPQRCPCDQGSMLQVQAENAKDIATRKNSSDSETRDRLQDIQEEPPCRCIGPSRVKELAKFFTPTSDEEDQSCVNTRTRWKRLFEPKGKEEEGNGKK